MYIDPVAQGHGATAFAVSLVHFTPGARSAWHAHEIGQTLYVTDGEGRIQSRGQPIVIIRPGDVTYTPADEWHWHGAAPDHFMTHLAITEGGAEWADHVTDTAYQGEANQL